MDMQKVGETINTEYFLVGKDILLVIPTTGLKDTAESARINTDFQQQFVRNAGHKCGVVVVMNNLLSQDATARRVYAEGMQPDLFFGAALVVTKPLARAIGSFFIGLSKPNIPLTLVDSLENGVKWLESIR